MNGRQKILKVLKKIKSESEINPDPLEVSFKFNRHIHIPGVLSIDQEKRILIKLEQEGVVRICLPDANDDAEESILSSYAPAEFMMEYDVSAIDLKILPRFDRKLFWYKLIHFDENSWNVVNPFWLVCKFLRIFWLGAKFIWSKSKVLTIALGGLIALLAYDWSRILDNFERALSFLRNIP